MDEPRYIWRELNGYAGLSPSGQAKPSSDFMILDSFYNYAVVYYDKSRGDGKGEAALPYVDRLAEVIRNCAKFNAEDAEQVAA